MAEAYHRTTDKPLQIHRSPLDPRHTGQSRKEFPDICTCHLVVARVEQDRLKLSHQHMKTRPVESARSPIEIPNDTHLLASRMESELGPQSQISIPFVFLLRMYMSCQATGTHKHLHQIPTSRKNQGPRLSFPVVVKTSEMYKLFSVLHLRLCRRTQGSGCVPRLSLLEQHPRKDTWREYPPDCH